MRNDTGSPVLGTLSDFVACIRRVLLLLVVVEFT